MKFRSSTSSSDPRRGRWPVAGLLALLLVLAIDGLVFRASSPWRWLSKQIEHGFYQGVVSDRLIIELLGRRREGKRYSVLMGTSRMQKAWQPHLLEPGKPEWLIVKSLAHARIFPAEMRAAAEEMRDRAPDVVVLGISEAETHVPMMLDRRTSFPGAFLYLEAARHLGMGWLFEKRDGLYRGALAGLVASYRHRDVLGNAGLDRLRRFPSDPEPIEPRVLDPVEAEVLAEFNRGADNEHPIETDMRKFRRHMAQIQAITAGPHVDAQREFLRRAVEIFRDAGSEVVILELPLHPSTRRLYDSELRADFLALAAELERDLAARVIRLEDQPGFERSDFWDLIHVGPEGEKKLTQTILTAILETPL